MNADMPVESIVIRLKRALLSSLALVLLFIVPFGCLLLTDLPNVLEMQIKMERAGSIRVGTRVADDRGGTPKLRYDRIKSCTGGASWKTVKVFLPTDFNPNDMVLAIDGDPRTVSIRNVTFTKRLVVGQSFEAVPKDDVWSCRPLGAARLSIPKKVSLAFAAFVIGLFVVSLAGTWLFAMPSSRRERLAVSSAVAFAAAAFIGLVVPLQSYLANQSAFLMTAGEFSFESIAFVLIATVLLGAALYFSSCSWGYFLHALFLAFVVYEYLQTGILSAGEPAINGELTYYSDKALKNRDLIALCLAVGVFAVGYRWIKRYLLWIVAALGVMIVASFFDVKTEKVKADEGADNLALASGLCSKFDAVQNTRYSTHRNIMMIVVDSVTTEVFAETLKRNPELATAFDGFTDFRNNFCPHTYTPFGVAVYMTGKCYENERANRATIHEYSLSCFGPDSLLLPFVRSDRAVSFVPGSTLYGFSWPRGAMNAAKAESEKPLGPAFLRRKNETPPLSLFDVTRFRLAPFGVKAPMLTTIFAGTHAHASIKQESELYPILEHAPIRDDVPLSLTIFHTEGAHPPFDVGRDGVPLSAPRMDFDGYCDKTCWVLKRVGDLLETFRRRGIYDNSMIIVTTDHGSGVCRDRLANGLSGCARAVLCVKPERARGALAVSSVPTSHTKLHDLLTSANDRALTGLDIERILQQEQRRYIEPSESGSRVWAIDRNGISSRIK